MDAESVRQRLRAGARARRATLLDWCGRLLAAPSETPPSDTRAVAGVAAAILRAVPGAEVALHTRQEPVVNVVARLRGGGPGRRLVFNGHLDTFPAGDRGGWSVEPFAATLRDGRVYGRGAADMKGGVACSLLAVALLADCRRDWPGEVVVTLAGDEERMGCLGTAHLLEAVPCATGDAVISGDLGSAAVLRCGEKGFLWIELRAAGRAAHGAHVHLGCNAIDRLVEAMTCLRAQVGGMRGRPPDALAAAMESASAVSERWSGAGETEVLRSVTVNFGVIGGGLSANLVPDAAWVRADVRVPAGLTTVEVEERIRAAITPVEGVSCSVLRRCEPNWSDPGHPIFALAAANVRRVTGREAVVTMRVGASDARLYRGVKGVPAVNCGLTGRNVGGPDESAEVEEMVDLVQVHALTAFDFLIGAG